METIDSFIHSMSGYKVSEDISGFNIVLELKENKQTAVILSNGLGLRNFVASLIITQR